MWPRLSWAISLSVRVRRSVAGREQDGERPGQQHRREAVGPCPVAARERTAHQGHDDGRQGPAGGHLEEHVGHQIARRVRLADVVAGFFDALRVVIPDVHKRLVQVWKALGVAALGAVAPRVDHLAMLDVAEMAELVARGLEGCAARFHHSKSL